MDRIAQPAPSPKPPIGCLDDALLDGATLLDAWEKCRARPVAEKPAALLDAAWSAGLRSAGSAAELPLGARDRHLLKLRLGTIGRVLALTGACPACGETFELDLDGEALLARFSTPDAAKDRSRVVTVGDLEARLRAIRGVDLADAGRAPDAEQCERRLLGRAVRALTRDGVPVDVEALSEAERRSVSSALAALDPDAEIHIDLECPDCGERFRQPFDVAATVTAELEGLAEKLLHEVAALARAFGWSEAEILALGPARRRAYLELAAP